MAIRSKSYNLLLLCIIFIVYFTALIFFYKAVYPSKFHGDAAAMQVLANSLIFTKDFFLNHDFGFGNQLVLFRSSQAIALAEILGFKGYRAYIYGSAFIATFWIMLFMITLNLLIKNKVKSFLISFLSFFPLGFFEFDYILGQQSHLSNIVLCFICVVSFILYLKELNIKYLFFSCIPLFLVSIEAPIRALFVIITLFLFLLISCNNIKINKNLCLHLLFILISVVFGLFLNRLLLKNFPILLNHFHTLEFTYIDKIISNIKYFSVETISLASAYNYLANRKISIVNIIFFGFSFLILFYYLFYFISLIVSLIKYTRNSLNINNIYYNQPYQEFKNLGYISIIGIITGLIIVSTLNPDSSRHFLWALFLFKLFILIDLFHINLKNNHAIIKISFFLGIMSFIVPSFPFATYLNGNLFKFPQSITKNLELFKIAKSETGLNKIYSTDFWITMPLNTLSPGSVAGVLKSDGSSNTWLGQQKWFSNGKEDGRVLYFILPQDNFLKDRLEKDGKLVIKDGNIEIWEGKPIF